MAPIALVGGAWLRVGVVAEVRVRFIVLWVISVGCGTTVRGPCEGLDEGTCEAHVLCLPVDGRPCDDPETEVYVGCIDAQGACNDITWMCAPEDTPDACVQMPSMCDFGGTDCPIGWVTCGSDPAGDCPQE